METTTTAERPEHLLRAEEEFDYLMIAGGRAMVAVKEGGELVLREATDQEVDLLVDAWRRAGRPSFG